MYICEDLLGKDMDVCVNIYTHPHTVQMLYTVNREILGVQIFSDGLWYLKIKNLKIFRQRTFTSMRVSDGQLVSQNICTQKL